MSKSNIYLNTKIRIIQYKNVSFEYIFVNGGINEVMGKLKLVPSIYKMDFEC